MQWRENLISAEGRRKGEMLAQAVPEPAATVTGEPAGATTHRLIGLINQVSPEEFRWQETNYDRDSALGRELLFRIAHNEWIRATAEVIDVMRTDAIDTTIKVEIVPELVPLETGRHGNGRLWLPVLVLPPPRDPTPKRSPEPDPFITLTVMDPDGIPFATLPGADVRHRIAAALAEIVVNMATARWPDTGNPSPYAAWDQRLVLAAAIYRLLNGELPDEPAGPDSAEPPGGLETMAQLRKARSQLYGTLSPFVGGQGEPDTGSASTLLQQLVQRAVTVLRAFSESVIVVVPVEPERIPSMLAIQVPSRTLSPLAREPWRLLDLSTWHWLHPDTWNWILPRAHLKIDLLLPSADADRLVQVNLPDGMSAFPAQPEKAAQLEIGVSQPSAMRHLSELMGQLTTELNTSAGELPSPLAQCLADLAAVKADAARHALRGYHAEVPAEGPGQPDGIDFDDGNAVRVKLGELGGLLAHFPAEKSRAAAAAALAGIWQGGSWLPQQLWRVTSADILAPQTAVAKAGMIDDRFSRAAPVEGRIHLHVAVTDAQPVGIATFSGWMSLLFMAVVLALLTVSEKLFKLGSPQVSPEVLGHRAHPVRGHPGRPNRASGCVSAAGVSGGQQQRPDRLVNSAGRHIRCRAGVRSDRLVAVRLGGRLHRRAAGPPGLDAPAGPFSAKPQRRAGNRIGGRRARAVDRSLRPPRRRGSAQQLVAGDYGERADDRRSRLRLRRPARPGRPRSAPAAERGRTIVRRFPAEAGGHGRSWFPRLLPDQSRAPERTSPRQNGRSAAGRIRTAHQCAGPA